MSAINKEQAQLEIDSWLDHKKIKDKKREAHKNSIETLVEAIKDGSLVLNDDKSLEYQLSFPVGKEGQVKSLKFKPRVSVTELQDRKNGNKPGDGDALILSTISALTGIAVAQLKNMDSGDDYDVCGSISVFFM